LIGNTNGVTIIFPDVPSPYSLGKLIDWKRPNKASNSGDWAGIATPYSLGKLIDWKRDTIIPKGTDTINSSLLVREIN